MAKQSPANVAQKQEETTVAAPQGASNVDLAAAAEKQAAERKAFIESLTFGELFEAIAKSAKWNDVLLAADYFGKAVTESAQAGGKPAAIAKKAAAIAPVSALRLRLSLASYSLSGRKANTTQMGELESKLPSLKDDGALRDRKISYGALVLPPIAGEI